MRRSSYLEQHLPYPQPWEFIIDNVLGRYTNGTFVDVGASDPFIATNTAYMEIDLNWNGICIEPHPIFFKKLDESSRTCKKYNCAVSDFNGSVDFVTVDGYASMLSGIKENYNNEHWKRLVDETNQHGDNVEIIKIECKTLSSILKENNMTNIDYLSIDTEGSELKVLKGVDFEEYNIKVISAENQTSDTSVRNFLESNGYRFVSKICSDEIFIKI